MTLIFKHGGLCERQRYNAEDMLSCYPFAALLSEAPNTDGFTVFEIEGEGSVGESYTKRTRMYGRFEVQAGQLFFFKSRDDYDAVCMFQGHIVIDSNPFQTVIQDRRPESVKAMESTPMRRLTFWERVRAVFAPEMIEVPA